jgi:FkbM family methyltransferase
MINTIASKLGLILRTIRSGGGTAGVKMAWVLLLNKNASIKFDGLKHPVLVRGGTSDADVALATFIRKEYITPRKDFFEIILDLGANVGYSAVYFASHYPNAKIICLEPDAVNFKCLEVNVKHYDNIILINKGVWWRQANLMIENPEADSWAFRFKEVQQGGTPSVAIDDLLREYSCNGKIMVKMDIEGAESDIFRECGNWIQETSCIQLEIHDCWREVFDRLSNFNYKARISGENIVIEIDRD